MSQDLMCGAEVKALVRGAYRNLPPTTAAVAHKIYSDAELATIPRTAVDRALGVANHLRLRRVSSPPRRSSTSAAEPASTRSSPPSAPDRPDG
jgi:hypothetical protein